MLINTGEVNRSKGRFKCQVNGKDLEHQRSWCTYHKCQVINKWWKEDNSPAKPCFLILLANYKLNSLRIGSTPFTIFLPPLSIQLDVLVTSCGKPNIASDPHILYSCLGDNLTELWWDLQDLIWLDFGDEQRYQCLTLGSSTDKKGILLSRAKLTRQKVSLLVLARPYFLTSQEVHAPSPKVF